MRRSLIGGAALAVLGSVLAGAPVSLGQESGEARTIARWLFDEGKGEIASDGADGATNGKIVNATWGEGRSGGALVFEDYSTRDYLRPDVGRASRVVVPHHDRINPSGPFALKAVIFPTKDPLYYGGIVEKGRGYGASYRLVLLRGLKVRAALGAAHATVTSAEPISLNAWHDVELIFDGSSLILRVDGKEQGRSPDGKGALASKEEILVGDRFSGRIDEVTLTAP